MGRKGDGASSHPPDSSLLSKQRLEMLKRRTYLYFCYLSLQSLSDRSVLSELFREITDELPELWRQFIRS
jgi:hypothetical protein